LASLIPTTAYGFCDELTQDFTSTPELYDVGPPTIGNEPANALVGPINSFKATLLSELFTKFYDPTWTLPGPYTNTEITDAMAFHAAIEEIVHESINGTADLSSLNLDAGFFQLQGTSYILNPNDPSQLLPDVKAQGQFYLNSLIGSDPDPKYLILQVANGTYQDFLIPIAVPELSSTEYYYRGLLCSSGCL
jgi:hypothetical protein